VYQTSPGDDAKSILICAASKTECEVTVATEVKERPQESSHLRRPAKSLLIFKLF
jgi:hypothetical protein